MRNRRSLTSCGPRAEQGSPKFVPPQERIVHLREPRTARCTVEHRSIRQVDLLPGPRACRAWSRTVVGERSKTVEPFKTVLHRAIVGQSPSSRCRPRFSSRTDRHVGGTRQRRSNESCAEASPPKLALGSGPTASRDDLRAAGIVTNLRGLLKKKDEVGRIWGLIATVFTSYRTVEIVGPKRGTSRT